LHAQSVSPKQALKHVLAVRAQWAGPNYAAADLRISSAYADTDGLEHVYVQQLHRDIPVYNRVQALAFQRGRLASHAGKFVSSKDLAALAALSAAAAVSRALQHLTATSSAAPSSQTSTTGPAPGATPLPCNWYCKA